MALLFVMFSCVFVTFPYGVSGQVCTCLHRLELCLLLYFDKYTAICMIYMFSTCKSGTRIANVYRDTFKAMLMYDTFVPVFGI